MLVGQRNGHKPGEQPPFWTVAVTNPGVLGQFGFRQHRLQSLRKGPRIANSIGPFRQAPGSSRKCNEKIFHLSALPYRLQPEIHDALQPANEARNPHLEARTADYGHGDSYCFCAPLCIRGRRRPDKVAEGHFRVTTARGDVATRATVDGGTTAEIAEA